MLTSRQPIWVGWGPELTYLYNDAYRAVIGGRHPWALGRPTLEVWQEIEAEIAPMLATAMEGQQGVYVEQQLLIMERNGYPEETYYTFSYSPIPDDDGHAGGIICANSDDTARVIGQRQLALLSELAPGAVAHDIRDACRLATEALATDPRDLPFAAIYLALGEGDGETYERIALHGLPDDHGLAPPRLAIGDLYAGLPIPTLPAEPMLVDGIAPLIGDHASVAWGRPPRQALLLPFDAAGQRGLLVAGLSPVRLPDEGYRDFLALVADRIGAAIARGAAVETERRRAEALAELDRAKSLFFSNVSHEFRTPLTLMLGPIEELLGATEGATRALVEVSHRNALRLLRLVNTLLDFARVEAGQIRARFTAVDLPALTAELASNFEPACTRAGLTLEVTSEPLTGPVHVDRVMWEKVILNLLSNAFKYTFEGGIRIALADRGDHVEIRVTDSGVGIPEAELPRLFERFHRIEGQRGRTHEGSGIGLALVEDLMLRHQGTIRAESRLGEGSSFVMTLPYGTAHLPADQILVVPGETDGANPGAALVEEALRWLPDETAPVATETGTPGATRVLIADDNADMRAHIARLLGPLNYAIETVGDGEQALETIRRDRPDIVISDAMMPRLDGFGLLAAIRGDAELRTLPVILLSARAGEEAMVEGIEAGADDYLTKPFAAKELLARVQSTLAAARLRRAATDEIRASELRLRTLFENAPGFIAIMRGPDLVFEFVNQTYMRMFGERGGYVGRAFAEVFHEAEPGLILRRVFETGTRHRGTAAPIAFDSGHDFTLDFVAEPILDAEGNVTGVFLEGHDVSDRHRAEDKLRELNETLERRIADAIAEREEAAEALRQAQKMEAVGQLTGGVAHDFNNLLMIIIGNLDMVIRSLDRGDDERARRAVDNAQKGADRAASLTQRLLAFSRRQPLAPKMVDVDRLVAGMSDLLGRALGETIRLETVTTPGLWTVEADPNQLENCLLNLAVNARDAMPRGGRLTIETANTSLDASRLSADADLTPGPYVVIGVSDSGTGMAPEVLERVFEPFFTTKEVGRGTGLGLSMVYGFVKQSGGHIDIHSEEGVGTTIRIYLPRRTTESVPEEVPEEERAGEPGHAEHILVVEDDADVRAYTVEILRELGYRVLEAPDGPAALRLIERRDQPIDLLFTDVVMPEMSGRELVEHARMLRPGLPVLYTSGYTRDAIVHDGRLDPGIEMIAKPFTYQALATRLRELLDTAPPAY
jgi:PAS domain S-box-containing protein